MQAYKVALAMLISLSITMTVFAQASDATPTDDEVNRVAKNLYCPVCENVPLDVCESIACKDWREEIRLKLSEGWSDQQIYDYFVAQHGDRVLATPPARGFNWLVYVVPPLAILAGFGLLWKTLRSARANAIASANQQNQAPKKSAQDEAYIAQLEEELEQRE